MKKIAATIIIAIAFGIAPNAFAYDIDPTLSSVLATRPDLQAAFDERGVAVPGTAAGWLIDIYDWAEQYGWRERPELAAFAPVAEYIPERLSGTTEPVVTAQAYVVVDKTSGLILAANNADKEWPIASLTKLATAEVAIEAGLDSNAVWNIKACDDVGGSKLYVADDASITIEDLFLASLVTSANNAANALARATGLDSTDFIAAMNHLPFLLGLSRTHFVDPTGIELDNVSTAREMARLSGYVFGREEIRRYTTTGACQIDILTTNQTKNLLSTNWMLWKPGFGDIVVTAGKTGYLNESGWNLAVELRPAAADSDEELLLVLFGSTSRAESFTDAKTLADWAWQGFEWRKNITMASH